ncbi:MAG: hypothetical protein JSV16_02250 [Candidatus Hydrogenedentota bacterium]|nr:MAG: hypothetical protein JSV16_02250 [Candidatus Hydrogenedentota bacterium]
MYGLQPTRFTLFHILWLAAVAGCVMVGTTVGLRHFGAIGLIAGGVIGFVVGALVGAVPEWVASWMFFREIKRSSNLELRSAVAEDGWNFCHTVALLQLAARGEDVRGELDRILGMLESDSKLTRIYGWDALRIVYPKETKIIADYNPRESAEGCRSKAAKLKATLKETEGLGPKEGATGASEGAPSNGRF